MEGYNRFFIVGLLVIGLVGVYAGNRGDLSAQQSNESLSTIEDAAVQSAVEETPRILIKRSNPHSYPPRSREGALDLTMKTQREYESARRTEQRGLKTLEMAESVQQYRNSMFTLSQAQQIQDAQDKRNAVRNHMTTKDPEAKKKQSQPLNSRARGTGSSQGRRLGSSRQ